MGQGETPETGDLSVREVSISQSQLLCHGEGLLLRRVNVLSCQSRREDRMTMVLDVAEAVPV